MAKKRKAKKKKSKKPTKPKSRAPKPKAKTALGLHSKKLLILEEIPTMPCSAIAKDRQGLMFAHTQATKVYKTYREACLKHGLTTRRISGTTTNIEYPEVFWEHGKANVISVKAVLFEGEWEIRDTETGETETFGGSGIGDNRVWSANSAQTVAKKQALLDYFETAWPQPTDWARVVRESLESLKGKNFTEAIKQIMPEPAYKILTATKAIKEMEEYFGKEIPCQKPKKSKT